jgi:hypothetical protein
LLGHYTKSNGASTKIGKKMKRPYDFYRTANGNAKIGHNAEPPIWTMMNLGAIFLAMNQIDSSLFYSTGS